MRPHFLFILSVAWAYEKSSVSTCLWHINKCVESCPEGMVEVKSSCSQSYWPAQRTCQQLEVMLVGTVCGFSRCECPAGMVLDTETGICYDEDNCPTKHFE